MIDLIKQNKIVFGIIVGVIALFIWFGMREPQASNDLLGSTGASSDMAANQEIIRILLDMRSIRLDSAIFENPAFATLRDDSLEIQQEPIGKANPFEPSTLEITTTPQGDSEVTN